MRSMETTFQEKWQDELGLVRSDMLREFRLFRESFGIVKESIVIFQIFFFIYFISQSHLTSQQFNDIHRKYENSIN